MSDYIRRADAVDAVAFGITIASAFNSETGERIDLFVKENDELRKAIKRIHELPSADVAPMETLKAEIYKLKHQSEQGFGNHDYYVGYISALSTVEGILAWMDEKE